LAMLMLIGSLASTLSFPTLDNFLDGQQDAP
jgi:hypothetical protein